jgi:hypothetical protein
LPPDGRVSHEFFLNLHPTSPFCAGIQGKQRESVKKLLFYVSTASIVNPVLEGQIKKKTFFVPTTSVVGESKPRKATMIPEKEKIEKCDCEIWESRMFFLESYSPSLNSKARCVAIFF